MKKSTFWSLALLAGGLLVSGNALADPIRTPTTVKLSDVVGSPNATYYTWSNPAKSRHGGAFEMSVFDQNGDKMETMLAFCLEVNESFSKNTPYQFKTNLFARKGGRGGQTSANPNKDWLSKKSAWIYTQALSEYADADSDGLFENLRDVQYALWWLEDEFIKKTGKYTKKQDLKHSLKHEYGNQWKSHKEIINEMIESAQKAIDDGWKNEDVVVYNIYSGRGENKVHHQSMIGLMVPPTGGQEPIPEPTLLLLIGGGLLGAAGMRRRRRMV